MEAEIEPVSGEAKSKLGDLSQPEMKQKMQRLRTEVERRRAAHEQFEVQLGDDEEIEKLSDKELDERIDLLQEQLQLEKRLGQLDKKAVNIGLMKAYDARRCNYLRSNGKPCKAPALGDRLQCVFHLRSHESVETSKVQVRLLEDRQSLQLTVKDIMEKIVADHIDPAKASLLLRAVQIANSTVKNKRPKKVVSSPEDEDPEYFASILKGI